MKNRTIQLGDKRFDLFIPHAIIRDEVEKLASTINEHYRDIGGQVLIVSVLDGAFMFTADLIRHLDFDLKLEFVKLSSYEGLMSTGQIHETLPVERTLIEDRHVLIVEDIVDTGKTLHYYVEKLQSYNPRSLRVCTLLNKPDAIKYKLPLDFIGMNIPLEFIVGYGMDYNGMGRQMKDIYQLAINN